MDVTTLNPSNFQLIDIRYLRQIIISHTSWATDNVLNSDKFKGQNVINEVTYLFFWIYFDSKHLKLNSVQLSNSYLWMYSFHIGMRKRFFLFNHLHYRSSYLPIIFLFSVLFTIVLLYETLGVCQKTYCPLIWLWGLFFQLRKLLKKWKCRSVSLGTNGF